jgi:pimeloyl-ACP methyl ester carboxylesterase
MKEENSFLSDEQAHHLTVHGAIRNEDGTYSWKFDNYLNVWTVGDISYSEQEQLWRAITCPMLLLYGADSWASNPERDGRAAQFKTAKVVEYAKAGHWLHHDQFERFVADMRGFL